MEGLVAVGLASNILQFVAFATSIVSNTKTFYDNASGAKDEYQDAEGYAQRVQRLAAQVAIPQAPYGGGVSVEEKELKELGERCSEIANELLEAARGVTEASHKNWVQSARKAVKARLSSSQIKSLQGRLDRISQELTGKRFQAQLQNTERALSEMAAENRRLSSRRDEDIHHLQEQLQHVTGLLEKGESQRDIVIALSAAAETGAPFTAEELIVRRLIFHGMNERHANVHVEHEETLSWIFKEDSPVLFTEFLESESSLYWVSGKPGSGKSTAMKYICQHPETERRLERWAKGKKLIVAKFFFWNAGKSSLLKSQEGLLRSILYQIFREAPALIPDAFPEDWSAYLSGDLIISLSSAGSFSITQLLAAFQLLCTHISDVDIKICLFVDGLDEYDGRPDDVIGFIETLKTSKSLKACISSRPWNEFERAFGQNERNRLYMQDLTKSDIRRYVRDTLENNETFRELVHSEGEERSMLLVREIVDTAQGVFLWVILVVRSLLDGLRNADTFSNLQRRLESLPTDLDGFFERILFSADELYSRQASEMCLVTLTSIRRLPLMSYWFMDEDNRTDSLTLKVQPMEQKLIDTRLEATRKRLNAYCKGLLEVVHVGSKRDVDPDLWCKFFDQKVEFLHRTVRDFLKAPHTHRRLFGRLPGGFNPRLAICQALLAQVKSSPNVKSDHFDRLLENIFTQASAFEDERIPVRSEIKFMDELGSTLRIQAKLAGFEAFRDTPSPCLSQNFLLLCVSAGLLRYLHKVLRRRPKLSRDALSRLIGKANLGIRQGTYDQLRNTRIGVEFHESGRWSESHLQFIQCLLEVGADPNSQVKSWRGTAWTTFLDAFVSGSFKKDEARIAFSIFEEYTKHGANLQSIEGAHPERGLSYYKAALERKFTKDEFHELLRLADSKGTRGGLVGRRRRFSGLCKFLQKIGRDG